MTTINDKDIRILEYLSEDDFNIRQLGRLLNVPYESLRYSINKLLHIKLIKQVGWHVQRSKMPLPIYSTRLNAPTVEKYVPMPNAERSRRYRTKYKALISLRAKSRRLQKSNQENK
jgi:DNA-binding Lrp family transcriptional regulator